VLTVLQVAYPFAPVSLDAVGGAEQVAAALDRGLTARGHRSIVIACAGSQTCGRLVPIEVCPPFDVRARVSVHRRVTEAIRETLESTPVDLVHMHGLDYHEYLPAEGVPVLATLHMPVSYYPASIFQSSRPHTILNCVSEAQRRTFPRCTQIVDSIDNGIPLELFPRSSGPREEFALALGRICPEKGFHLALEAAGQAGTPLWIAGSVFPYQEHEQYFERELLPRLSPPHRFLGPVGFAEKVELLSRARCLVLSSLVAESASLAAMEAMACGTPVVSFSRGAPATFIENGKTGFQVNSVKEMAAAILRCGEIHAEDCRRRARLSFSADRMVNRYIDLYARLLTPSGIAVEA
jgi:glycosyltransferase involved in cell wall biosynthesis